MDFIRAKIEIENPSNSLLFAVRACHHTPYAPPFLPVTLYYLHITSHILYPTNPALHTQQTTLENFCLTPPENDVFPAPPQPPNSVPRRLKSPCTTKMIIWAWLST